MLLLQPTNFTLGPDATFYTEIHKKSVRIRKAPNSKASLGKFGRKVKEEMA